MAALTANKKIKNNKIVLEIDRNNFEEFCGTVGLFKKSFLNTLQKSFNDHDEGKITKRKSLKELMDQFIVYEIITTKTFDRLFKKLDRKIQEKAVKKSDFFKNNPFNKTLRIEKLHTKKIEVWSFRVDIYYRIIFRFSNKDEVEFLFIGHHNDIYDYVKLF